MFLVVVKYIVYKHLKSLHLGTQEKLVDVIDHLLPPLEGYMQLEASTKHGTVYFIPEREVTIEELIIGALETAFWDMVISKHTEKMC